MNKKTLSLLSIAGLFVLMLVPSVAAASLAGGLNAMRAFLTNYGAYKDVYNFIFLAVVFMAVFRLGFVGATRALGWGASAGNAVKTLIAVLGIGTGIGTFFYLRSMGIYPMDWLGQFGPLILIMIITIGLGYIFYKGGASTRMKPFIIALVIVASFFLLEAMFPGFPDNLGGFEWFIYIVFGISVIYLIVEIFLFALAHFGGPRFRKALTGPQMAETQKSYQQSGAIDIAKQQRTIAKQAGKKERKSRNAIRKLGPLLKKSAKLLAKLHQDVGLNKPRNISGKWKIIRSDLKELTDYGKRIGAYSGLINMIATEISALPTAKVPATLVTQMAALRKSLLLNFANLQDDIKKIASGVKKIHAKSAVPTNWGIVSSAIKRAGVRLNRIESDALGIQTLEVQVKKLV